MDKIVLSAQSLLDDSYRLAGRVLASGFKPTIIIAIWRGGAPVGMAVQEFVRYCGVNTDHIAIRTSSYTGVDQRRGQVRVMGLDYIINKVTPDHRLLIVDDVFDTGHTIAAVLQAIRKQARGNTPREMRVAVPWFKPTRNQTDLTPDYFVHETDAWLVFPHELDALTPDEMRRERPALHDVVVPLRADRKAAS
ncbi:MAG: phosphoribosyltransferase family protein [Pseudomonadota bacterium]